MPSSSKFSFVAGALDTATDCDRGIPAIDPTVVAVAFPNKLLINPARYAK
jgi:hypothetical protein